MESNLMIQIELLLDLKQKFTLYIICIEGNLFLQIPF